VVTEIRIVELMDRGTVARPEGIVYSTDPLASMDEAGNQYIVKGPDLNIVVSEAIAYILAGELGIMTPGFALGYFADDESALWFASAKEENVIRGGDRLLSACPSASTILAMGALVAFDAWIANTDRNSGNVLVRGSAKELEIVAIDFEKAEALRGPHPLMQSTVVDPKKLRPTGDLARAVTQPVQWGGFLQRLQDLPDDTIKDAVQTVESAVGSSFTWADSTCQALQKRKMKLPQILTEIWS
jgi:hypothetical protein